MKRITSIVTVLFAFVQVAIAQENASLPPSNYLSFKAGMGGTVITDEWLSPLKYGGTAYTLSGEGEFPFTYKGQWMLRMDSYFQYSNTLNPAQNASISYFRGEIHPEAMVRFALPYGFRLGVGPGIRIAGGARIHSRNGNNPASFDAKADITAGVLLGWRVPSPKWPIAFRLYANINTIGVANRIGYAESYYEQFYVDGGFVRSALCTHWGNQLQSTLSFTVDVPLWNAITLQAGYRFDADAARISSRRKIMTTHTGFVGISFETLWLRGRRAATSDKAKSFLFGNVAL